MNLLIPSLAGLGFGTGLLLVLYNLPRKKGIDFVQRINPQLRGSDTGSRLLHAQTLTYTPFSSLERITRPVLEDLVRRIAKLSPSTNSISAKLIRAGSQKSVNDIRIEQVLWALGGLALSLVLALFLISRGTSNIALLIFLLGSLTIAGFMGRNTYLSYQANRREKQMLAEFPTLADMLALAVSAGESMSGALERICRSASGELVREFESVLADTRSGTPMLDALRTLAMRVRIAPIARFVDGISVAVERGTPLADVIRAQAQDVRDLSKQELMESAGKKEIGMMIPLVFGVLPLTIIFAAFPGMSFLRLGLN